MKATKMPKVKPCRPSIDAKLIADQQAEIKLLREDRARLHALIRAIKSRDVNLMSAVLIEFELLYGSVL